MQCEQAAQLLPRAAERQEAADRKLVRHVSSCLACQAELARYHGLLRGLHQLRSQRPELPGGLVGDVLGAIETATTRRAVVSALTGRRLAYAGGACLGATLAALAVVLAVGRGRSRGSLGNRGGASANVALRPCDRLAVRGMAIDRGQ